MGVCLFRIYFSFYSRLSKFEPSVQQTQRLGKVYKKVAYVEYTDSTFTKKKSQNNALIGPELRGEVNDRFQVKQPITLSLIFIYSFEN